MRFKLAIGSAFLLTIAVLVHTAFLGSALIDGYKVSEIKHFLIPIDAASEVIEKALANNEKRLSITEMRDVLFGQQRAIVLDRQNLLDRKKGNARTDNLSEEVNAMPLDIMIILKSGSKLVSTALDEPDSEVPEELVEQIIAISTGEAATGLDFVEDMNYYYVPKLLIDSNDRWIVSLVFQFHKSALRSKVSGNLDRHFFPTLVIAAISIMGLFLLYYRLARSNVGLSKKDFIFDFIVFMLASLSCSLLVNLVIFEDQILSSSAEVAQQTILEISHDIEQHELVLEPERMVENQQLVFAESFSRFDNFESVELFNPQKTSLVKLAPDRNIVSILQLTAQTLVIGHLPDQQFLVLGSLSDLATDKDVGLIARITISKADIFRNSISMLIDGITILFVSALAMVELLLLYLHLLTRKNVQKQDGASYELGFVRPSIFLFLIAIDLSLSFVPLHMQSLDAELFGMSRDIVLGLPISAEFLCVGIFLLVAGVWMDRRGWHEPFFVGLLVVGLGTLSSWVANDALFFILSRALVGVGYGLTLMSAQGLIINYCGVNGRASGFSNLFAGLYSGSICGAAAGAILAERFGYEKVFLFGFFIIIVLVIFSATFLRSAISLSRNLNPSAEKSKQAIRLGPLLKFIGNPLFIALNVLSSLPASIAVAGFIHFFAPVYLNQIGTRDSTIGQVLILYGVCLVYFGPMIGRFIDRSKQKKYYLLGGGVLGGLAFVSFNADLGIASMLVSVFLLGLSSSFVLSSQSTMILELKSSRDLGEGTALGIFRSISRIGQVVGPIIFGWVLLSSSLTEAVNTLGYTYLGAIIVLALFVIKHREGSEEITGATEDQKPATSD